jgi:hypothetical protein
VGTTQLGHRVHVLPLRRGRPVVAGAEEPHGELGLGHGRGHGDVGGGDGGGGGEIPGDLAVGLHEVGVAVGGPVQGIEGGGLELDVLAGGGGEQRPVGGLPVEPVDAQVPEQPLRVALRRAEHRGQVGETRADDDQRRALLGQLVAGGADRGHVVGLHVLHLVDEQRDPAADVGGHPGGVAEQLDQVDLHVPGVGPPARRGDVDARLPPVAHLGGRSVRPHPPALGERLQDAQDLIHRLLVAVPGTELAQRHVQRGGDRPAQRLLGPRLDLAGAPTAGDGRRAQLVEQHGLPDATQPGEHEGALGAAVRDALQHHVEGRELRVAAGQLGRALPGARRVRVPHGIHVEHRMAFSSSIRRDR